MVIAFKCQKLNDENKEFLFLGLVSVISLSGASQTMKDILLRRTKYLKHIQAKNDEEGLNYTAHSRLFITMLRSESELLFEKTYFINVWDEAKKKFILLDKINRNIVKNK